MNSSKGIRLKRLTLFGPYGSKKQYVVDFTDAQGGWVPLAIIAGASQSGKSSVVDYVLYCLGGSHFPEHQEMRNNVAGVAIDIEFAGEPVRIERTTTGAPSKFASIWLGQHDGESRAAERRLTIDPPSDPESLSQFLLGGFGLSGIRVPLSERSDSDTHAFSFRDVAKLIHLPNSRLDNKNLVFEDGNTIVAQKFQHTFDLVFDVADATVADIQNRLKLAEEAARESERTLQSVRSVVEDEYPEGPTGVEIQLADEVAAVGLLEERIRELDHGATRLDNEVTSLRSELDRARSELDVASTRIRDRQSLLDRLNALRLDYSEDLRKLTFLQQAERVFDPFHIDACPACLNALSHPTTPHDGMCGLCGQPVGHPIEERAGASETIQRESRAVSSRLSSLVEYLGRLTEELSVFEQRRDAASARFNSAVHALDQASELPAPFLAARDSLSAQLADKKGDLERHRLGARLWDRVERAHTEWQLRLGVAAAIRKERAAVTSRVDRATVIRSVSERFEQILAEIGYPKLNNPFIDSKLIPHVRGSVYTQASSGGLTLISLAWYLAVWEVAFESNASTPGLLIIDSPQKNLGARVRDDDTDFADTRLVDAFYAHVESWLAGAGAGAQLVVVDNTPPQHVRHHVIIEFTGRPDVYPFGLIDDAIT